MEEIPNNHLRCIKKPVNNGINYQPELDVSENSGTPKSSILIEFSIIFTIHFGVFPYFWFNTQLVSRIWAINSNHMPGISALRLGKGVRVLRVFRLIRVLKGGGILQDESDSSALMWGT